MRGSVRSGLIAVAAVCLFALFASNALAADPNLFYTNNAETQALPDAQGNNGGVKGFGYPIEFANSGNLKLTATGFSNTCEEGELDTYLNHNTEALVDAMLVGGQFECEFPTFLATPSTADAVFKGANEVVVKELKFLVQVGAANCVFTTPVAGIKGTWTNAVGGEEGLGSTIEFSAVTLSGSGTGCPTSWTLTAKFGAETFLQAEVPESAFDTEQVFYG
jgi:hypothetical protein